MYTSFMMPGYSIRTFSFLQLKTESSVSHGGQDFIFFQIESFSLLVKFYGDDSPQVMAAICMACV